MTIEEKSKAVTLSTVTSKDGTVVSFKSIGEGPGVIIVPGALSTTDDFMIFAQELADSFTVHVIDRRGRGLSGPQGNDYSIRKEAEDLAAVQTATGAAYIFGHSFGGLVTLEAARMNDSFKKIALYEPGVSMNKSFPTTWFTPYEQALDHNDAFKAFAIFVRATGPVPKFLPLWYLKFILRMMLPKDEWARKKRLLRQSLLEHKEVGRLDSSFGNYSTIGSDTLLIAGEKSQEAVRMINVLDQTLPYAKTLILPKFGHLAPMDRKTAAAVARNVKSYYLS